MQRCLPGFMIEDEDDFSTSIQVAVIVVMQLRGGNAETGEHYGRGTVHIGGKSAHSFGSAPLYSVCASGRDDVAACAIGPVLDQVHWLKVSIISSRFKAGLREFGGDSLNGHVIAGLQGHAATQCVGGEQGEVRAEGRVLDGLKAGSYACRRRSLRFECELGEKKHSTALPGFDSLMKLAPI